MTACFVALISVVPSGTSGPSFPDPNRVARALATARWRSSGASSTTSGPAGTRLSVT